MYWVRLQSVLFCNVLWLSSPAWAQKRSLDEILSPLQLKVENQTLPYRELSPEGWEPIVHYFRDFHRTLTEQPDPEPSKEIVAIKMACKTVGLSVHVVASVLRGTIDKTDRFSLAKLDAELFGTYVLHLDQTLSLDELQQFGIEPLRVSVVMATPSVQKQPRIVNNVPSLEVTRIEERQNAFDLFLTNSSMKPILGLDVSIPRKNGGSGLSLTGWQGPLISPGKEHYVLVHKGPATMGTGQVPTFDPELSEIVIVAALFADGSHEGDDRVAARIAALWQGIQIQSARLLGIVKRTLNLPVRFGAGALDEFRREVASVPESFDPSVLENLAGRYSSLGENLRRFLGFQLEAGLKGAKQRLLFDSEQLEREQSPLNRVAAFESWLVRRKDDYEQLLAWSTP